MVEDSTHYLEGLKIATMVKERKSNTLYTPCPTTSKYLFIIPDSKFREDYSQSSSIFKTSYFLSFKEAIDKILVMHK